MSLPEAFTHQDKLLTVDTNISKFLEGLEVDRVASLWPIDGNDRNLRLTGVVNGHADSGLGDHDDQISFGDLVIWRNMN